MSVPYDYDQTNIEHLHCGHAMFEYDGDEMHWELDDGDECPYCGRPIMRVWGWLV